MKKTLLGLTLIELLVTVAVIAIIVLIGLPRFQSLMESNRMTASLNRLSGDLNFARSEAIKRGQMVTVCGSDNASSCDTNLWEKGWIVFVDTNRDGQYTANTSDSLLRISQALPPGLTLRPTYFDSLAHVEFLPDGQLRDENNDGTAHGTFRVCPQDKNAKHALALNVNNLGRISIAIDTTNDGIVNDVTNADISCP